MTRQTAAVIGLGSMGYGVASSLLRAGHVVHGFDINADAVARLQKDGGAPGTLAEVAGGCDVVISVVINAAQTEAVLFGDGGIVAHLAPGTVVMSCATVAPDFARSMEARCTDAGLLYIDAPISGGPQRSARGELSVLASGAPEAFAKARPCLDAMASQVYGLGDSAGPGSAMKAINQMLVGINLAGMAEALTFGMTQGVTPEKFAEIIPQCAGTSWVLENRVGHVVDGDYSPLSAVDIWPKDLGICLDVAHSAKFGAPVTAAALQQWLAAQGSGLGREDDAALVKVYARNAGLTLPGAE
ncbi:NAD(P)-dependent oxidoreductase [Maribius pontilimi]|uniref:L-threonate dehydrogenase n=1 Tax=Palleronia pontilimi TaxID=1964209 RepID=A0A934IJF5_9RHOB|nr:L-threonate dehydrogenase [Palleronia pontilimi]MBJ3764051.1 NAD(P)-dependent oxidoreductase [Palleronia pontilimi]